MRVNPKKITTTRCILPDNCRQAVPLWDLLPQNNFFAVSAVIPKTRGARLNMLG